MREPFAAACTVLPPIALGILTLNEPAFVQKPGPVEYAAVALWGTAVAYVSWGGGWLAQEGPSLVRNYRERRRIRKDWEAMEREQSRFMHPTDIDSTKVITLTPDQYNVLQ